LHDDDIPTLRSSEERKRPVDFMRRSMPIPAAAAADDELNEGGAVAMKLCCIARLGAEPPEMMVAGAACIDEEGVAVSLVAGGA
jgi:hypothetical protein